MRKDLDMDRQHETPTQYNRPQVTSAQVETYQMTKTFADDHRRPSQMDSSLSVSPTGQITPQRSIISNAPEAVRGHVLPDDRSLVNSGEFSFVYSFFLSCVL